MAYRSNSGRKTLVINTENLILLTCLTTVGSVMGRVLDSGAVTSLSFTASFFLVFATLLFAFMMRKMRSNDFILLALCIAGAFFSILFSNPGLITFEYAKKMIIFCCTLIMLQLSSTIRISEKGMKCLLYIGGVCALLSASIYFFQGNREAIAGGITLRFTNPNEAGMYLLHGWLYCILLIEWEKQIMRKSFFAILSVAALYLIVLTKARSCLIAAAVMIEFLLFCRAGKTKFMARRTFALLIVLFPLLFAIIYEPFLSSRFVDFFSFMVSAGKNLTARQEIWNKAWSAISRSPLMGDYYGISGGTGLSQLHNTSLDVLASYGVIVGLGYHISLYNAIRRVAKSVHSRRQMVALCAFYCAMIQGTFEAAFVSGGSGLYLLTCGFLILARNYSSEYDTPM